MELEKIVNREIRIVNRNFSLAEYDSTWTKMERYLFIEIYNVIKDFYIGKSDKNIKSFSAELITVLAPVKLLNDKLFDNKNRATQLMKAADGLSKKQFNTINYDDNGQAGWVFRNIFSALSYDPNTDKNNILVELTHHTFDKMIPIESFCQLDLKLLDELNSGNTIRLYEIFKSYAFKKKFTIAFIELRKKLGFFKEGKYEEWKHFNSQVLKPAILDINKHKEFDIEVRYQKVRGAFDIEFIIIQHHIQSTDKIKILDLDFIIQPDDRSLNMKQNLYIDTLIKNCNRTILISSPDELKEWIISDLISQQTKQDDQFNFKYSCNAISKQIRNGGYMLPYSHKHLV